jgi:hypothetical protein
MKRLADSDPTALEEGPEGTIWWASNDAYAQAYGNKPKYAGRVHGVSKNILPVQGTSIPITRCPRILPFYNSFRNDSVCNSIERSAT